MAVDINSLPEEAQKALDQFLEFQISEFIDSGANGYVMIGRHGVLRKNVAIKIYFHDENEIDQEPAIIASLHHENVLKVYDARRVEKYCSFYMMQAANAGDLLSFKDKYNISLLLAHRLLCQLLSGLSALHCEDKKLVHRDLKPENLLVHDDKIIIADFGSVRKVDDVTGKATSKHSILFRPPESFGDDAFYDFSSDVYQVGLIGYILFGGSLANDLTKYLNKVEVRELQKVKGTGGEYEISKFIDTCIEKRIKSGNLLDWSSLPFYVPKKMKRILKTAVSAHGKRFKNVSEFLSELAKIRSTIPDWITVQNGFILSNWKGNDYLIVELEDSFITKKRKHGGKQFRTDKSIKGSTVHELYENLYKCIVLP